MSYFLCLPIDANEIHLHMSEKFSSGTINPKQKKIYSFLL